MSDHPTGCVCVMCQVGGEVVAKPATVHESQLSSEQAAALAQMRQDCPRTLAEARALGFKVADGEGLMCYRSIESRDNHLSIAAYGILEDGSIAMTVAHGRDSSMPGVGRIGTTPDWLIPCGCGRWEHSTPEQRDMMKRRLVAVSANDIARQKRQALTRRRPH